MRIRLTLCIVLTFGVLHAVALSQGAVDSSEHAHHQPGNAPPAPRVSDGTRRMIELLEKVNRVNYVGQNPFAQAPRLDMLKELTKVSPENNPLLAQELIKAGRQDDAVNLVLELKPKYAGNAAMQLVLDRTLALAYLRQGELENCIANHTSETCLFPIKGSGVHKLQRGSRAAIEVLKSVLQRSPGDLQSLWLLNLAYMTLGNHPDSVPPQYLLAPELFASEYDLPRFTDVAPSLGIDGRELAGGCCTEDFDRDGDIDIIASSWGMKSPMSYYRNNGDGTFTDATAESGLAGLTGGLNMVHADYDNDGDDDVLVLRGAWLQQFGRYPNSLLRNNGDGTFDDVTIDAGLLSYHPTQTAVFADLNKDGWLDIFIGNESGAQPHPCELYINNHNGTFTERGHEAGLDVTAFVKGVTCGDYNNDGWQDLYLSCHMGANCLLRNNGIKRGRLSFTDVTRTAGVGAPTASFPTFFFDYDNDGWDDIFVCGYGVRDFSSTVSNVVAMVVRDYRHEPSGGEMPRLYHNNHNGTFTDVTAATKMCRLMLGMGANFGDIDNDGYPDIYVGTGLPDMNSLMPNRMFRNAEGKFFQDVTTAGGFGHLQKGHAISFVDIDNDGDQDVYTVMGGAFEGDVANRALFLNPGNTNHWVTLSLEGVQSNRSAIGARITVSVTTPRGNRTIYNTVNTGGSFGASTLQQEIGLGDATRINAITVTWPNSKPKSVFHTVEMDHFYGVREGEGKLRPITRTVLMLGGAKGGDGEGHDHHHHHHHD